MEIEKKLNPHLKSILDFDEPKNIEYMSPLELLNPDRLDVIAKFLYAKHKLYGVEDVWAKKIYAEHLAVWNNFIEGDGSGKASLNDFIVSFDDLLEGMAENGFDSNVSLLPIGDANTIIDGGHRLAASLLYASQVGVVKFKFSARKYDSDFFLKQGLSVEAVEALVFEYCRLKRNVKIAVIFPVAKDRYQDVLTKISEHGKVLHEKDLCFTDRGRGNLIRTIYDGEEWLGDGKHDSIAVLHHTNGRFDDFNPVRFIFFEENDKADLRALKEEIRSMFGLGNASIHINDTYSQTIDLAGLLLYKNGVHWLNHAVVSSFKNFNKFFSEYHEKLSVAELDSDRYCLDGSAVLALYGLRDVNDLDYLVFGRDLLANSSDTDIGCHNTELHNHNHTLDELVFNSNNFLYWKGVKFISLDVIKEMKKKRDEAKDRYDVKKIELLDVSLSFSRYIQMELQYGLKKKMQMVKYRLYRLLIEIIPKPLKPYVRKLYSLPFTIIEMLGPVEKEIEYKRFKVFYTKGTSLIERIRRGETYEPELTGKIISRLHKIENPVFLDVGANIGLMSLNILDSYKDAKIFAFEPGAHQSEYFEKTMLFNGMGDQVKLFKSALSNKQGTMEFSVHSNRHSSGDGFFDTGRAGKTRSVTVNVTTIDHWWRENAEPNVDLVKIDTEGAELWVLEGASDFIRECRPVFFLEMHPKNLDPYPYDAEDILKFFNGKKYILEDLGGVRVDLDNLQLTLKKTQDFVASPLK